MGIVQSLTLCFLPIGSSIFYPLLSFSVFTVYHAHFFVAIKLALVPLSVKTISLFHSKFTLFTGISSFLLSIYAIFRRSLFAVVGSLSFLILKLSLSLEEAILGTKIVLMDLNLLFTLKFKDLGCFVELSLYRDILAEAS